jgi:AMP nucleosidase
VFGVSDLLRQQPLYEIVTVAPTAEAATTPLGLSILPACAMANFRLPVGTLPRALRHAPLRLGQAAAWRTKLSGMASDCYRCQVNQHLEIGIRAMEKLRAMAPERLHSRKLRSFQETAFQ